MDQDIATAGVIRRHMLLCRAQPHSLVGGRLHRRRRASTAVQHRVVMSLLGVRMQRRRLDVRSYVLETCGRVLRDENSLSFRSGCQYSGWLSCMFGAEFIGICNVMKVN